MASPATIKSNLARALSSLVLLVFSIITVAGDCPSGYSSVECCVKSFVSSSKSTAYDSPISSSQSVNAYGTDGIINIHNSYRAAHHAPPLTYSQSLQIEAQQLANDCVEEIKSTGENMSIMFGDSVPRDQEILASAITTWYNTISNYNFNNPKFYEKAGLATQLLWKNTRQVGCAIGVCPKSKRLIVCKYNPSGNVFGQFGENVLPK